MCESVATATHELHSRVNDGILVRLLWRTVDDHLWVSVADAKQDNHFSVEVRERSRALDVFHHPFAYAAHYGIDTNSTGMLPSWA